MNDLKVSDIMCKWYIWAVVGYVIGKNLIVTFESSKEVLNLKIVKSLVNEHLIKDDKIK